MTPAAPTGALHRSTRAAVGGLLILANPRLAPLLLIDQDIDRFLELMDNPEFSRNFYPLVSARGRGPSR